MLIRVHLRTGTVNWPGIQLMVRVVLYLIFTINQNNDTGVILFGTILVTMIYFGLSSHLSVYKNVFVNAIEAFLMLNISLVSACILFIITSNSGSITAISSIITASAASVFVTFITFHSCETVKDFIKLIKQRKLIQHSELKDNYNSHVCLCPRANRSFFAIELLGTTFRLIKQKYCNTFR